MIQLEPSHPPAGSPDATAQYLGALMDGLAGGGLRHLVFCPGSRSTPVLLAAHRHGGLRLWQHVDERSAAFFALGVAKVLAEPVAVLATSGTAAANFLPAVVEARYSRAPLILLTADRPRELRDVGAAQTIDQVNLYGSHVKWAVDLLKRDYFAKDPEEIIERLFDLADHGERDPEKLRAAVLRKKAA